MSYRPVYRGDQWLIMDTVTGETYSPGYQNKGVCSVACETFVAPYTAVRLVTPDSSAVEMRTYARTHGIDLGDCRTREQLYSMITKTPEEIPKDVKKADDFEEMKKSDPYADIPTGKALTYLPKKVDGQYYVYNSKTKRMRRKGYALRVDCLQACAKLNEKV